MGIFDIFRRKRKTVAQTVKAQQEQTFLKEQAVPATPRKPDRPSLHEMLMEKLVVTDTSDEFYKALVSELSKNSTAGKIASIVIERSEYKEVAPVDTAVELTLKTVSNQFHGMRPECMLQDILDCLPNLSRDEAVDLARSVQSKTASALTRVRSERYGRAFYQWDTCGDGERVRCSHRNLDGVICCWADPPHPEALIGEPDIGSFHPGEAKLCRCTALPVIDVKDIRFPARVHKQGIIYTVASLEEFLSLFGV